MKKIQGRIRDILGAFRVCSRYRKAVKSSPASRDFKDPIGALARKLHPGVLTLELIERKEVGEGAYFLTFAAVDAKIPLYRPGQFMTLIKRIGDSILTRAYTICSDASKRESISILIKRMGGPFTDFLSSCPVGETFASEIGLGTFYYEPLRDSRNLVVLVGGSGVTPAIALAYAAKDYDMTILFGVNAQEEILLREELESLASDKIKLVYVIRDGGKDIPCEKGLIDAKLIQKYMGEDPTFFICGPKPMIDMTRGELEKLGVPSRRIRVEPPSLHGLPVDEDSASKGTYELIVHIGRSVTRIAARGDEPLLTAFERAGIYVHSACRSGACGFCRVKVLQGKYRYLPSSDGLRYADKELNYVHSCATFPMEDMEVLLDIPVDF